MSLRICQHIVQDPMSLWRAYAQRHPRTIREYDLGDPGNPGVLTAPEAWRSRIINSHLTYVQRDKLIQRAKDAPWADVPADADLVDADPVAPDGLFGNATRLYWTFTWPDRIHGVRAAKVHKVLHIKRSGLYPILDDRLRELYRPCAATWLERLPHFEGLTAADSPPYWAAFRDDLLANRDELERYRNQLANDEDEAVQLMARLTLVRLQDIIAWMVVDSCAI
jgi:hypothetical protein